MDKVKLVVDQKVGELPELPKPSKLKLNLNGRKPRRGKNLYRKKLNKLRRTLRW